MVQRREHSGFILFSVDKMIWPNLHNILNPVIPGYYSLYDAKILTAQCFKNTKMSKYGSGVKTPLAVKKAIPKSDRTLIWHYANNADLANIKVLLFKILFFRNIFHLCIIYH